MSNRRVIIKTPEQLEKMRASGRLVAEILGVLGEAIKPGITTADLDRLAEELMRRHDAKPSFKGYPPNTRNPFPGSICVAVNDEVVHGIPGPRVLQEGDIISVDVGVVLDGWQGDATMSYAVGEVDGESLRLMRTCSQALDAGVAQARAGNRVRDIASAIEQVVERERFSVVYGLYGHGLGQSLHEAPLIPHYVLSKEREHLDRKLVPGMVITIEPMITAGSRKTKVLRDGWTIVTNDGSRSAQFEHTVAITNNGPWVLSLP